MIIYYHDATTGQYHAIKHLGPGKWSAWMDLDRNNGLPRSWTGERSKAAALAVLHHLAPEAVELPGLPAWLR